ncbi:MAG: endonuclease/exonuclease/phosphatase family protein [Planctomycetota bacterium]
MLKRVFVVASYAGLALGLSAGLVSCQSGALCTLDGDITEWSSSAAAAADADHVYLRFKVTDGTEAIQAGSKTVVLYIDADSNATTGRAGTADPLTAMGVDLEIHFSPRDKATGKPGKGVAAYAVGGDGSMNHLANIDTGLTFAPTYASDWYEARIDRGLFSKAGVDTSSAKLTGVFATLSEAGEIDAAADRFEVTLPAAREGARPVVDVPGRMADTIRVVTYNVQKSKPVQSPDSFARVLDKLDPDVIVLEEWDQGDAASVEEWFRAHWGSPTPWHVHKTSGTGVLIASKFPLSPLPPDTLELTQGKEKPSRIRFASAIVDTPAGALMVTGVHLKCCGGASGPEEQTRQAEAKALNMALGQFAAGATVSRVVVGDLNLVGSRVPLDLLRAGLDSDGTDLGVVAPRVLGDSTHTTWVDWSTEFTPARLDWVLFGRTGAKVAQSFVLDTSLLSAESLARMGLDKGDTSASDHMPVVVDFVLTPAAPKAAEPEPAKVDAPEAGEMGK